MSHVRRRWRAFAAACWAVFAMGAVACGGSTSPGDSRVAAIALSDTTVVLHVGDQAALTAQPRGADGGSLVGRPIFWASKDTSIVAVSQTGVVQAVGLGSTQIAASAEGQTALATVTVLSRPITTVQVEPAAVELVVNGHQQLTVRALNDAGAVATAPVTWTSATPAIVSVTADGVVTGIAPGTATIRATSEGVTGSATVHVTAAPAASVSSVQLTPALATLAVGDSRAFAATARAADGSTISGRTVTWSSGGPSVITVSSTGVATAVGEGTAQVLAQVDGITGTALITVQRAAVAAVSITPNPATVPAGAAVQLTAAPRDGAGRALSGRVITWTSSDAGIATVTSDGNVTGVNPGTVEVRATSEGVSGSVTVTVTTVVRVAPATVTVRDHSNAGRTAQLVATDQNGRQLSSSDVTWTSSAPAIATVDANGLVRGISSGTGTATAVITATYHGATATCTVTVTHS